MSQEVRSKVDLLPVLLQLKQGHVLYVDPERANGTRCLSGCSHVMQQVRARKPAFQSWLCLLLIMWLNAGHLTPLSLNFPILIKVLIIVSHTKEFLCSPLLWHLYMMVWASCLGQPTLPIFCFPASSLPWVILALCQDDWSKAGLGWWPWAPWLWHCDPFSTWWWLPVWDLGQLHPHRVWVVTYRWWP